MSYPRTSSAEFKVLSMMQGGEPTPQQRIYLQQQQQQQQRDLAYLNASTALGGAINLAPNAVQGQAGSMSAMHQYPGTAGMSA
ncbi:hypothetical protein HK101_000253, partial [Irineochytrium annulatum]